MLNDQSWKHLPSTGFLCASQRPISDSFLYSHKLPWTCSLTNFQMVLCDSIPWGPWIEGHYWFCKLLNQCSSPLPLSFPCLQCAWMIGRKYWTCMAEAKWHPFPWNLRVPSNALPQFPSLKPFFAIYTPRNAFQFFLTRTASKSRIQYFHFALTTLKTV